MNENEDYFRFYQRGSLHVLSNRIPFRGSDLIIAPLSVAIPLMAFIGWFQGLVAGLLTFVVYGGYRYMASLKYEEFQIDANSGAVELVRKNKGRVLETVSIDKHFDPSQVLFEELKRSGTTKYLMRYRTHKDHDLLIIKTEKDKNEIKSYLEQLATFNQNQNT